MQSWRVHPVPVSCLRDRRRGWSRARLVEDRAMQEPMDHPSATILVVDDDESLRLLMVSLLTRSGYRTLAARNGDEALRIIASEPGIDLLLTDIVMPGQLDGFALAAKALQLRPALKIVYTSGYIRKSDAIGNRPPAPIIK